MELMLGLNDELVAYNIFPRTPWYSRPVMRAVCKSWKTLIDEMMVDKVHIHRSRKLQAPRLKGLIASDTSGTFFIQDGKKWRIPDIQDSGKRVYDTACFACEGYVFLVWKCAVEATYVEDVLDEIYMIDLWAGTWKWRRTTGLRRVVAIVSYGDTIYGVCSGTTTELDATTLVWRALSSHGQCLEWLQHAFTGQGSIYGVFGFNLSEIRRFNVVRSSWELVVHGVNNVMVTFAGGRLVKLIDQRLHGWDCESSTWVSSGVDLELGTSSIVGSVQGVGFNGLLVRCFYPPVVVKGILDWDHCLFYKEIIYAFPPAGYYNYRCASFIS